MPGDACIAEVGEAGILAVVVGAVEVDPMVVAATGVGPDLGEVGTTVAVVVVGEGPMVVVVTGAGVAEGEVGCVDCVASSAVLVAAVVAAAEAELMIAVAVVAVATGTAAFEAAAPAGVDAAVPAGVDVVAPSVVAAVGANGDDAVPTATAGADVDSEASQAGPVVAQVVVDAVVVVAMVVRPMIPADAEVTLMDQIHGCYLATFVHWIVYLARNR